MRFVPALGLHGLFRSYVVTLAGLVTACVLLIGLILVPYHYAQDRERAAQIQIAEALIAADTIDNYLRGIEQTLHSLSLRSEEGLVASREAQAMDFREALKFQPAIINIRSVDGQFLETNFVSRTEPDRLLSLQPQTAIQRESADCHREFCYGAARVRDETEPYVTVVVAAHGGREAVVADLSMRFINDLLRKLSIGKFGRAYVVERDGRLIAHPELRTLLMHANVAGLPQVDQARRALDAGRAPAPSSWGDSPEGGAVFTTVTMIVGPQWMVFVEQPAREVLAAVRATIGVTVLVLVLGAVAACLASLGLAKRLTRPILLLRDGANRLGSGDLTATIDIHSRDEIEAVATAFNAMAGSLRNLYDSLEAKVIERTRDLAQANLQISAQASELSLLNKTLEGKLKELALKREEADKASAAKSRFVAAASHDLRQPMHAVGLLVGILAERHVSPELKSLLAKIQWSVAALEKLFGSLLDISKLDAGIVKPQRTCVSVSALLRSVELSHSQAAAGKGLSLRIADCRTLVFSDHALLLSILGNLVSNAVRYTEQGHVDVYCRKRGNRIAMFVADSGIGIPADQLGRVFDEFYQLNAAGRDHGQGLGLGLAIVKRTADLLGYSLIARSRLGIGSVFGIELPMARREHIREVSGPPSSDDARLPGAFIVVVDDDDESRYATEATFRSWGCHVIAGSSGEAVRRELAQHLRQPDLIVADYWLRSGETGLMVVERLRHEAEIEVPALILSADYTLPLNDLPPYSGIAFIQKPASAAKIRRAVAALLHQATLADA